MSLIDIGTTAYIANSVTTNLFNANAWNFFTDGWLGRGASAATNNSNEFSLYELVTGALGVNAYPGSTTATYGVNIGSASNAGAAGTTDYALTSIRNNLQRNGGQLLGTVIVAPVVAKIAKKMLAKPLINPVNRALKASGISSATGVKL